MTTKITFWSDTVDEVNMPKNTFKNLKVDTIKGMMRTALIKDGKDGDIWATKQVTNRDEWTETTLCFVRDGFNIFEDSPED